MTLFPTQEIGSLPKATPAEIQRWSARIGRAAPPQGEELVPARSRFNVAFLKASGLDLLYDGEAHRIEMAEHPYRAIGGAEFVGHVRSFDNKYFRKAAVRAAPSLKHPYHSEEYSFVAHETAARPEALKVPITGPYTLAEWAYNDYYLGRREDRYRREGREAAQRELVVALARDVVRPTIADLIRLGARRLQVDEPALGTHPHETAVAVEGFEEAVRGQEATFGMHVCYSDYASLLPGLLEARSCSEWLWEFANRDAPGQDGYEVLNRLREYGDHRAVGVGVVDVHRDSIESAELVAERIGRAARYLRDPAKVHVNPDCGLRTRSWEVIWGKLRAVVQGAELARRNESRP